MLVARICNGRIIGVAFLGCGGREVGGVKVVVMRAVGLAGSGLWGWWDEVCGDDVFGVVGIRAVGLAGWGLW